MRSKRYNLYAKKISEVSGPIISNLGHEFGFGNNIVINKWKNIAGSDIARVARPIKMQFNQQKNSYIITILIQDLSLWSSWKMIDSSIKYKLEDILHKPCIIKVKM